MITNPSTLTVKINFSTYFILDISIAHRKGQRSYTMHLISIFISYDLTPLSRQFALSISSVSIPKSFQEAVLYPVIEASYG